MAFPFQSTAITGHLRVIQQSLCCFYGKVLFPRLIYSMSVGLIHCSTLLGVWPCQPLKAHREEPWPQLVLLCWLGFVLIPVKSQNTGLGRVMSALTIRNRGKEAKIKVTGGCTWGERKCRFPPDNISLNKSWETRHVLLEKNNNEEIAVLLSALQTTPNPLCITAVPSGSKRG